MRKKVLTSLALGVLLFSAWSGNALAAEAGGEYRAVFAERERLLNLFSSEGADAVPALIEALHTGENAFLHRTAAHLLVRLGEPALEGIEEALEHRDFQVRRIAIDGLAEMGMLPPYWTRVLEDEHPSIRRYARLSLMEQYIGDEELDLVMDDFVQTYREGSPEVRLNVVQAVAETTPLSPEARKLLVEASRDEVGEIQRLAFRVVVEPTIERMRALASEEDWQGLIEEFGDEDIGAWPDTAARDIGGVEATSEASEAHLLRGRAYYSLNDGEKAEADLKAAIERHPDTGGNASNRYLASVWSRRAANFRNNLGDADKAVDAYVSGFETGASTARIWGALLNATSILEGQGRHERVLELLDRVGMDRPSGAWRSRFHNAYADALALLAEGLAEQGRAQEAAAKYREALELDAISDSRREALEEALEALD